MYEEQIGWAAEANVDLVIGETFEFVDEALVALDVIKQVNLPSVITLAILQDGLTRCGKTPADALRTIKEAGADVVGLNCARGPDTMLPLLKDIRKTVSGPLAALPVAYRTTTKNPTMQSLSSLENKYQDLDPHTCTRFDIERFTKDAVALGVHYLGVCCGGAPHHVRAMAEALGRKPKSSTFTADLSKHFVFGTKEGVGAVGVSDFLRRKNEW